MLNKLILFLAIYSTVAFAVDEVKCFKQASVYSNNIASLTINGKQAVVNGSFMVKCHESIDLEWAVESDPYQEVELKVDIEGEESFHIIENSGRYGFSSGYQVIN